MQEGVLVDSEPSFGGAKTLAEVGKNEVLPDLTEYARRMPAGKGEAFLRHAVRYFDPWPDWVSSMIVEIMRVYVPTIPKSTINDTVRVGHFFLFTFKLNCSIEKNLVKFPEMDERQWGALLGHLVALVDKNTSLLKSALGKKEISIKEYKANGGYVSVEKVLIDFQPAIIAFLKAYPAKLLEFVEGISNAKQNTFDKNGALRKTSLTDVYGLMVKNWPKIEELSGPTELCAFLNPGLPKDHFRYESQLDRVKKICRRMEIEFKPFVEGGQAAPPSLSLPEKV